jgi:hypothetical protein
MSQHPQQAILDAQPVGAIEYAVPSARPPARTFAATMILFGGLALIVLGGCFLIGILITIQHTGFSGAAQPSVPLTPGEAVFVIVLSLLALAVFAGAGVLLVIGTRSLLRVTRM